MPQSAGVSRVDLLDALTHLFNDEELRTLCFKLTGVDYDSLRGEGKEAKARELVEYAERTDRFEELVEAVQRERPTYSPTRAQELATSILASAKPQMRDEFVEFNQQIEAYLNEFHSLHKQLQEWKQVHDVLQDLQFTFGPCRGYIVALSQLASSGRAAQKQCEKMLYEVEVEWRAFRRSLFKLQELAANVHVISGSRQPSEPGPDWARHPLNGANEVDKALFDSDVMALADKLSAFGNAVDQSLYIADKALLAVANQINDLPQPILPRTRLP